MGTKGIPIKSDRFEEALKLKEVSKRSLAKMISEKTGVNADATRATVQRWVRDSKMSETNLLMVSEILDVSPLYIEGKLTVKAKKRQRKDSNGLYVPTYQQYYFETKVKQFIADESKHPRNTYFEYIFDKYEITSKDGKRLKASEVPQEAMEGAIVKAIQDFCNRRINTVTWKIESEEE